MATTNEMVQGWLSTNGAATTPEQATGKEPLPAAGVGGKARHDLGEESVSTGESTSDDLMSGIESTPEGTESEEPGSSQANSPSPSKETLVITDDKGRRKVEIDWNNKDQLKKYVQMAYGARKWQAERDTARQESQALKTQHSELQSNWNTLEQAYSKQGLEGVIDLLEGQRGAYKAWEKRVAEKARFMENASPEELETFKARETADTTKRELDRMRKENEDFRKQVSQEKEQADLRSLESKVHPVFDRYRFADKLGDPNDEHMFDEMLWNTALKRLEPYEEKGLPVSPELIEREFRNVASSLRKRIGLQAEKKASKVIEAKKQEATENVQSSVKNGYKGGGGAASEARDMINDRNLTGLLSNWKKYGSLFNK